MEVSVTVSGFHRMVISELSSGAWLHIAGFLDGYDLLQVYRTGNGALIARLRSTIDSLSIRFLPPTSLQLPTILLAFRGLSHLPRRLSLHCKSLSILQLREELNYSEIWSHLPVSLRELSLTFPLHSPHLQALNVAQHTPNLEVLKISELHKTAVLSLPSSLMSLEIGTFEWGEETIDADLLLPNLPSGLRILKIGPRLVSRDPKNLCLRRLMLEVLRVEIVLVFASPKRRISWSFLPSTISDLYIDIYLGTERANAHAPQDGESWSSLFPNLSALTVPLPYLLNQDLKSSNSADLIAHYFPDSITSISLLNASRGSSLHGDIALIFGLIARAIGPRLLRLNGIPSGLSSSHHLPYLPNWINPRVSLVNNTMTSHAEEIDLAYRSNPCPLLSTSAESLSMGLLLPEFIPSLPRSLTSLEFTMPKTVSFDLLGPIFNWPPALTSLSMTINHSGCSIHFDNLPKTLVSLQYRAFRHVETHGDLANLISLRSLSIHHGSDCVSLFSTPTSLPSSLTHLHTDGLVLDKSIFCSAFMNHLEQLKTLKLRGCAYSINIINYLPKKLVNLLFKCESEDHWTSKLISALPRSLASFNNIGAERCSRSMRGSDLLLLPPHLSSLTFSVGLGAKGLPIDFGEFVPLSLTHLYGPTHEIVARWRQRQDERLECRRQQLFFKHLQHLRHGIQSSQNSLTSTMNDWDEYRFSHNLSKIFSLRNPIIASELSVSQVEDISAMKVRSLKRSASDPPRLTSKVAQFEPPLSPPPVAPTFHWAVLKVPSKLEPSASAPKLRSRNSSMLASQRAAPGRKTTFFNRHPDISLYFPSPTQSSRKSSRLTSLSAK